MLRWRRLLVVAWTTTVAWSVALSASTGWAGLTRSVRSRYDYAAALPVVRRVGFGPFVRTYVDHLGGAPTHVKSHPPGMVVLLRGLEVLGLRGSGWAAVVLIAVTATVPIGVAVTVHRLGAGAAARAVLPFLVCGPWTLLVATVADGLFAAAVVWGTALLAAASAGGSPPRCRARPRLGRAPGRLALPQLRAGPPRRGAWRPPSSCPPGGTVSSRRCWPGRPSSVAAWTLAGFDWFGGFRAARALYHSGAAAHRPYSYFVVANVAVFAVMLGPAVVAAWASPSEAAARRRARSSSVALDPFVPPLRWLVGAAVVAVAIADLSGLSKGEVERIWLPFVPFATLVVVRLAVEPPDCRVDRRAGGRGHRPPDPARLALVGGDARAGARQRWGRLHRFARRRPAARRRARGRRAGLARADRARRPPRRSGGWCRVPVERRPRSGQLAAARSRGVDAVCHQAARVGLGLDFADVRDYVDHNDAGTAAMLWSLHDAGFTGRLVLASSMVVYGEGAYRCPRHDGVRPAARTADDLAAGRFEPACPRCGRPVTWRTTSRGHAARSPQRVRRDQAPPGAPLLGLRTRARRRRHRPALPQRLRTEDAPRHALRRCGQPVPQPPRGRPAAARSSRTAARPATSSTSTTSPGPTCSPLTAPDAYDGPLNIASGRPVTVLEMASAIAGGSGSPLSPVVTGGYRLGDVRHVVASPQRARDVLGFRAAIDPVAGLAAFADAPLRRPPAGAAGATPLGAGASAVGR